MLLISVQLHAEKRPNIIYIMTDDQRWDAFHFFVLDWPEGENFLISSFTPENGLDASEIASVQLLGNEQSISFIATTKGISVNLPDNKPCDHAFCFKFQLK